MPASSVRELSRQWVGRLASYRRHRNNEHLEALVEESIRYCGLHLENDLSTSAYWSKAPLSRCAAVLLYLVDRGVVMRDSSKGRRIFLPTENAEIWISRQPNLTPYLTPMLELLKALRDEHIRRIQRSCP